MKRLSRTLEPMTSSALTPKPLADVVALITGANKGLGYEAARLLGLKGAVVLVGARDDHRGKTAVEALQSIGIDAHHVSLDVTNQETIDDATRWIEADHGRLDILVNNAGITGPADGDPADEPAPGDWGRPSTTSVTAMRAVYETNVFGAVAVTNALLPLLRQAPAGRIVNVSSSLGSITATLDPGAAEWSFMMAAAYPSSKSALNMVTAMYAKELADTPIKVNVANPGFCATDLNGHQGYRTAEQGADTIVHLATLGPDGPTGTFYGDLSDSDKPDGPYGTIPW
jgi:NAD(P)-dependent dehydrogenase (short-subunit alcohol dehydrogenase family)